MPQSLSPEPLRETAARLPLGKLAPECGPMSGVRAMWPDSIRGIGFLVWHEESVYIRWRSERTGASLIVL